jgi:predicted Zn-dependent protease
MVSDRFARGASMKDILDRVAGYFDHTEVFYLNEKGRKIEARDGEICAAEFKEEEGYALRVIKDARPAFAYTYDRTDPAGKLITNVEALLPVVEKDEYGVFAPACGGYPVAPLYDAAGMAVGDDEKRSMLMTMEKDHQGARQQDNGRQDCEFHEVELEAPWGIRNGVLVEGRKTLFVWSAMAVAGQGDDEVSWYDWRWSDDLTGVDRPDGLDIAEKVVSMLSARQIPTGTYEGILTPRRRRTCSASCRSLFSRRTVQGQDAVEGKGRCAVLRERA